ncbi:hypothetical protein Nepgr_024611 [Nepenthes gracilis]|uniref:Uncharacterized protein n=1 Tax=Nepenthes gracilis TaxID=150966 RepID=A0AAD3XYY9_NEPGR|nr:hypothetical protein Nepgr_024611 [Nepenthes gracilis]
MMTAMPYDLQGKGVVEISGISQISSAKWKNIEESSSKITNKSCTGGGCNTAKIAGVAALSDSSLIKCPISQPEPTPGSSRKEEWAAELENLHNGSDIASGSSSATAGGGCGGVAGGDGLGFGDFESFFPVGDGALLPWITGEADDHGLGLKHLLQAVNSSEYDSDAGIVAVDPNSALDCIAAGGISGEGNSMASLNSSLGFTFSGFNHIEKIDSISANCYSGVIGCKENPDPQNNLLSSLPNYLPVPVSLQFDLSDEKPQIFSPQLQMNQHQAHSIRNPSFLLPPPFDHFQLGKVHNPGADLVPSVVEVAKSPFVDQGHEFLLWKQQQQLLQQQFQVGLAHQLVPQHLQQVPTMAANKKVAAVTGNEIIHQHYQLQQHHLLQEQAVRDQLCKAADLIQTGNFLHAQEILARLNHQLSSPTKPLIRATLYVKEALQLLMLSSPVAALPPKCLSPYDVVHKMNAYRVFSEVSPIMQFMNFTCTQAILEALEDADDIHIIDFDIGCGAQWASFIQELPLRKRGAPSLKITAVASPSTYHPFELALMRNNLMQFANDLGVAFDLQVVNCGSFDPSSSNMPNFRTSENESIAVSFPIWATSASPNAFPLLLRIIKHQSPKIMVSLDRGCNRFDVPFSQHLLHALDLCKNLLESLDSVNVASDVLNKVEKFFIQPSIESTVMGRLHTPDKISHWKNLFASAGFSPLTFSNFNETQADYVVKRTPGSGFHVDKRQASLVLSWQRRELVAASAWRC